MKRSKADWRRCLLAARASLTEAKRREGSAAMLAQVRQLPCFSGVRSLLGYSALGAEADPEELLASGVASGVAVFVPSPSVVVDGHPRWLVWAGRSSQSNGMGVSAPFLEYPVLAVVPGVAFDLSGTRLGRGRGFYDRALADLRGAGAVQAVGLAFECQIISELPKDAWDQSVDFVVSEKRLVVAGAQSDPRGEAPGRCP